MGKLKVVNFAALPIIRVLKQMMIKLERWNDPTNLWS